MACRAPHREPGPNPDVRPARQRIRQAALNPPGRTSQGGQRDPLIFSLGLVVLRWYLHFRGHAPWAAGPKAERAAPVRTPKRPEKGVPAAGVEMLPGPPGAAAPPSALKLSPLGCS